MHRRKGSKDDLDLPPKPPSLELSNGDSTSLNGDTNATIMNGSVPPRPRTTSTPGSVPAPLRSSSIPPARAPPPSAGPFRTSFSVPGPPNGYAPPPPASASPYIRSFAPPPLPPAPNSAGLSPSGHHGHAHSRARSVSGFAPASPSPLSASFSLPPSTSNEGVNGNGIPPSPLGNGPPPRSAGLGHNRTRSMAPGPAMNGNGLLSPTSANGMTPSFTMPAMRSVSGGKSASEGNPSFDSAHRTALIRSTADTKPASPLATRPPSLRKRTVGSITSYFFFDLPAQPPPVHHPPEITATAAFTPAIYPCTSLNRAHFRNTPSQRTVPKNSLSTRLPMHLPSKHPFKSYLRQVQVRPTPAGLARASHLVPGHLLQHHHR